MAAEAATQREVTDKRFSRCCGCMTEWLACCWEWCKLCGEACWGACACGDCERNSITETDIEELSRDFYLDDAETDVEGLSRDSDMDDDESIEGERTSSRVSDVQATVHAETLHIPPTKVTPATPEHPS